MHLGMQQLQEIGFCLDTRMRQLCPVCEQSVPKVPTVEKYSQLPPRLSGTPYDVCCHCHNTVTVEGQTRIYKVRWGRCQRRKKARNQP